MLAPLPEEEDILDYLIAIGEAEPARGDLLELADPRPAPWAHRRPRRSSRTSVRTGSDIAYFDASALHKLVVTEPETEALKQGTRAWPRRATSRLAVVELIRSVRRADPALEPAARRLIGGNRVLLDATQIAPATLHMLDAIHGATAYRILPALAAFVSYDQRRLEAAEALGLPVTSPR